ncbi:MAG: hypothetical protein DRP18_03800 [Candidatus Aenigmatarchaeota archaeon]|nr:MAG: hypothetical protein DRP18_03800 [Candidatus Aenigmarchaeota archaeon]
MEVVVNRKGFEKFIRAIDKAGVSSEIEITKNEMKSVVVDAGHVFMIKGKLACMGKSNNIVIGTDTSKILKLLKLIKGETLTLKIDKSKLWLNDNVGIGLMDVSNDKIKEPELNLNVLAETDLSELHNIIKTGMNISDYCRFIAKDGKLIVEIEGDVDIIKFELGKAQGEGKALYSLDILDTLLKGHNNTGKLEFATDKPLKVSIDEGDFKVEYLLAPRIED